MPHRLLRKYDEVLERELYDRRCLFARLREAVFVGRYTWHPAVALIDASFLEPFEWLTAEGIKMKRRLMFLGLLAVAVCGGCAAPVKKVDVNKGLDAFYTQPRTVDLLTLRGTNMTVTYTGVTEYRVASVLPPLNAIPREPGLLEKCVDVIVGLGKWGLGWYFGAQIADKAFEQPRTVDPVVVQPEVVTVPAAQ